MLYQGHVTYIQGGKRDEMLLSATVKILSLILRPAVLGWCGKPECQRKPRPSARELINSVTLGSALSWN